MQLASPTTSQSRRALSSQRRMASPRHASSTPPMSPQRESEQAVGKLPSVMITAPSGGHSAGENEGRGVFAQNRKVPSNDLTRASGAREAGDDSGGVGARVEVLELGLEALANRMRGLESRLTKDLADAKEQVLASEQRVLDRMVEAMDQRVQKLACSAFAEVMLKSDIGGDGGGPHKVAAETKEIQGFVTPGRPTALPSMDEEPEQEYESGDTGSQRSGDTSMPPSEGRGSFVSTARVSPTPAPSSKAAAAATAAVLEASSPAELTDSQQRLATIDGIAWRVNTSLIGPSVRAPATGMSVAANLLGSGRTGGLPLDFRLDQGDGGVGVACVASDSRSDTPAAAVAALDGLDAEMAKLADLRRFASTILGVAGVASDYAPSPAQTPPPAIRRWGGGGGGSAGAPALAVVTPSASTTTDAPTGASSSLSRENVPARQQPVLQQQQWQDQQEEVQRRVGFPLGGSPSSLRERGCDVRALEVQIDAVASAGESRGAASSPPPALAPARHFGGIGFRDDGCFGNSKFRVGGLSEDSCQLFPAASPCRGLGVPVTEDVEVASGWLDAAVATAETPQRRQPRQQFQQQHQQPQQRQQQSGGATQPLGMDSSTAGAVDGGSGGGFLEF